MNKISKSLREGVRKLSIEALQERSGFALAKEGVYEKRRWPYRLIWPAMMLLVAWVAVKKFVYGLFGKKPCTNSFWFDGLSPGCRRIKEGAASWLALDAIYNFKKGGNAFSNFWVGGILNAQAVRNRKRLVASRLAEKILQVWQEEHEAVRIFSIASGSAQAVLEAILMAREVVPDLATEMLLLDLDESALEYSRELAQKMGIGNSIETVHASTYRVAGEMEKFQPHIVEMVGFLDYRPLRKAIALIRKLYDSMPDQSTLITANIAPNPERLFLHTVINWPMIYRTTSQFREIVEKGGFEKGLIVAEPLGIHNVAIVRK